VVVRISYDFTTDKVDEVVTKTSAGNFALGYTKGNVFEVFPIQTAKVLFWLGIIVMIVSVCGNAYTFVRAVGQQAVGYNAGGLTVSIFSPLWQGGLLIGVGSFQL
jgi:hypothetical protein